MSIYKPSLLDKFKDFVNGIKGNWDQYEDHVADFESHQVESASDDVHGISTELNSRLGSFRVVKSGYDSGAIINNMALNARSVYLLVTGATTANQSLYLISTNPDTIFITPIRDSQNVNITASGLNITVEAAFSMAYALIAMREYA